MTSFWFALAPVAWARRRLRPHAVCPPALLFFAVSLSAVVACSSTEKPAQQGGADAGLQGAGEAGAPGKCAGEATAQSCKTCCGFTKEIGDVFTKPYEACACERACKSVCGNTVCAAQRAEPDEACEECLSGQQATIDCTPQAIDACLLSRACADFDACSRDSLCTDKP